MAVLPQTGTQNPRMVDLTEYKQSTADIGENMGEGIPSPSNSRQNVVGIG